MKTLIAILFFTLLGTIAHAAPDSKPLEFADDHCMYADDSDKCRQDIKNDRSTEMMNHYSLAIRVCSKRNIKESWNRSTCFANASKVMRDRDFRKDVNECVTAMAFWSQDDKYETWEKKANCQSDVFAKRAARVGQSSFSNGSGQGDGTRN